MYLTLCARDAFTNRYGLMIYGVERAAAIVVDVTVDGDGGEHVCALLFSAAAWPYG